MKKLQFPLPTDKLPGAWHGSYPLFYERIFAALENTKNAICEIGTDSGGPLLAYRDYFPNAEIIGCDVNPAPMALAEKSRLFHYQQDAYTPQFLDVLKSHGQFAVMVDDGSHFFHHQAFFAEHYPPLLAPDGIALIEDIQSYDHVAQLIGKIPQGFFGYAVDLRWADDRYDSVCLAIERK